MRRRSLTGPYVINSIHWNFNRSNASVQFSSTRTHLALFRHQSHTRSHCLMLKRCLVRPTQCARRPTPLSRSTFRYEHNTSKPVAEQSKSRSDQKQGKKESWPRFIGVRVGLIAGGYITGKIYRHYYPKPDDNFSPYELISRDPISSTLSVFTLRPKSGERSANVAEIHEAWRTGIWNLQFKQPQLQITRAYTPIPLGRVEDTNELQFLIRRDPRGEVSSYLHRLPTSSEIEMRGPNVEYPISPDSQNIIFIAGGTGIAPALQVAHIMFTSADPTEASKKKLHILWANRSKEDISSSSNNGQPNPIIQHLDNLTRTHNPNIKISYFTDEDQQFITSNVISTALNHNPAPPASTRMNSQSDPTTQTSQETQIIISGPEGFISYLAGPKIWKDGREQQGPITGILGEILAKRERESQEKGDVRVWKV